MKGTCFLIPPGRSAPDTLLIFCLIFGQDLAPMAIMELAWFTSVRSEMSAWLPYIGMQCASALTPGRARKYRATMMF